jgi:hypothetical protein
MSADEDEQPGLGPAEANERVGYGRPPLGTRFRPGRQPRGRPKGVRNLSTVIAAALNERVAINENGRRRRITKLDAMAKQLANRAASGEARSTQMVLAHAQANEARPAQQDASRLGEADAIVVAELTRRLRRGTS